MLGGWGTGGGGGGLWGGGGGGGGVGGVARGGVGGAREGGVEAGVPAVGVLGARGMLAYVQHSSCLFQHTPSSAGLIPATGCVSYYCC